MEQKSKELLKYSQGGWKKTISFKTSTLSITGTTFGLRMVGSCLKVSYVFFLLLLLLFFASQVMISVTAFTELLRINSDLLMVSATLTLCLTIVTLKILNRLFAWISNCFCKYSISVYWLLTVFAKVFVCEGCLKHLLVSMIKRQFLLLNFKSSTSFKQAEHCF